MMVPSPLSLYTTYLGFKYYDLIWELCSKTGLVYFPFLILLLNSITKPFETAIGNGADISFRRTFIEFFLMVLVCYLAVAPAFHLDVKEIQYQPVCSNNQQGFKQAEVATPGHSGTTYDTMFQGMVLESVKVPALLGLVMDVSSGLTYAMMKKISCTQNINQVMQAVVMTRFSPPLQQQIQAFDNQCYLPAKTMFNMRNPALSTYQDTYKKYGGNSDLAWMGSHVLQQLYYSQLRPTQAIPPFPYSGAFRSPIVDANIKSGEMTAPQYGFPTCKDWWTDSRYGLRQAIVKEVNANTPNNKYLNELPLGDRVSAWLKQVGATFSGDQTAVADIIARGALYDANSMADRHMDAGGGCCRILRISALRLGSLKIIYLKSQWIRQKRKIHYPLCKH